MALVKIKYCKFFKIIISFKQVNSLYLLIQAIYIDYFVGWAVLTTSTYAKALKYAC